MALTIDELQIEIQAKGAEKANGIDAFTTSLAALKKMVNKSLINKLSELSSALDGIKVPITVNMNVKGMEELKNAVKAATAGVPTNVANISPAVDGSAVASEMDKIRDSTEPATQAFAQNASEARRVRRELTPAGVAASLASKSLVAVGAAAKIAGRALGALVSIVKLSASGLSKLVTPLKNIASGLLGAGKSGKQGASGLSKFVSSLKRILMYRVVRFILSNIARAAKEGVQNLVLYSKAIGGIDASRANATMSQFASISMQVKNTVGSALMPVLNALMPVIQTLANWFIIAANAVNQFFAAISGASTWSRAKKYAVNYADGLSKAAGAAKNLKNAMLGIDELNVISPNSGGGGGAGALDYGLMFEEATIGDGIRSFTDSLKEAIANGEWSAVGVLLGNKVNELVSKIGFAGFGTKLGGGVQRSLEVAYSFLSTINFDTIGTGIATFLNNAISNVDFSLLGATLAKKWTIITDTLYGFVATFDWTQLGKALSDAVNGWFSEIDWAKAGSTLSEGVKGILTSISTFIENTDWKSIGNKVAVFLRNIDWSGIFQKVMFIVGQALGAAVLSLWGFVKDAWGTVVDWWHDAAFEDGKFTVWGLLQGMWEVVKNIGEWLWTNFCKPIIDGVQSLFGINSPSTVFAEIGRNLIRGLLGGVRETWNSVVAFWDTSMSAWWANNISPWFTKDKWVEAGKGLVDGFKETWKNAVNTGIELFNKFISWINSKMKFSWPSAPLLGIKAGSVQLFTIPKIPKFEFGGFPADGQLFVARERGPEMVGTMGRRTAVANNDQIVQAVSEGVYEAVVAAMNGRSDGGGEYNFYLEGKPLEVSVTRRQNSGNRMYGRTLQRV